MKNHCYAAVLFIVVLAATGCHQEPTPTGLTVTTPPGVLKGGTGTPITTGDAAAVSPGLDKSKPDSDVHGAHNSVDHHHDEAHQHEHFIAQGAQITDHTIPLIRETQPCGNMTPEKRAQVVVARLNMIANTHGLNADSVFVRHVNGMTCVFYYHHHGPDSEGHILATVDPQTAGEFGDAHDPDRLAYWWRDVMRDHILLIQGKTPHWTTRYASTIEQLHVSIQNVQQGVPTHETIEQVLSQLPPADMEALRGLYSSVPVNYRPEPDNVHAAAAEHVDGEQHHDASTHDKHGPGGEDHALHHDD